MPAKTPVTLYFDPVSPYVWLACDAIAQVEAAGAEVSLQPVLFAGLLHAHGQKGPAEIAAKRDYTFRDVMRQAARQGRRFRGPPGHPFNPLLALRMCTAIATTMPQTALRRFALALIAACWERGADISDRATLVGIADACALDGLALAEAAADPAIKERLAAATAQAIADGVFGVPTFRAGDELFWGADRIDTLRWHLQGHRIDDTLLQEFLARPPLAQRRMG